MSVCVPCRREGIDRIATAFVDEIPVCEIHALRSPVLVPVKIQPTPPGAAAPLEPRSADPIRKEEPVSEETVRMNCKFGKPMHHRGRCAGAQKKRGEISTVIPPMRIPLNLPGSRKPRPNISRTGSIDEILAELNAKKVKIEAAIAALRDLYGLES